MDIIKIVFTSAFSIIAIFLLTKLAGNKQVAQLTLFDYINGITIGSIAAEMATELENPLRPLTAMTVYGLVTFLCSVVCSKSVKVRNKIFGKSIVLFYNGKFNKQNFKKARLDTSEFLMQCRTAGYFDISQIKLALFEPSGKISFLPMPANAPLTPTDMKIPEEATGEKINIIADGKICEENLAAIGKSHTWLLEKLSQNGIKSLKDVFLGIASANGECNFFF